MDGPQHRPIRADLPQLGQGSKEVRLVDLGQDLLAEEGADLLQLSGNGGVFVSQVRMAGLAVDDAQGMAAGGEIKVHRLDDRMVLIEEVNGHQIPYGRGGLVHQTAGLAEEDVLGVLADLGNFRLGDLAAEEQPIDNGADQHLKGRGGAQAGAGKHRGLAVGIKARDLAAQLRKPGADAPNQSGSGVDFTFLGHQGVQGNGAEGITLGENANGIGAVDPHSRLGIQVDRRRQHPAPLMVRVVAADLRPPGSREIPLRRPAKGRGEAPVQNFLLCLCQFQAL